MTAAQTYYRALFEGFLPASVPIITVDGESIGLATQAFDASKPQAKELSESQNMQDRATAAIMVCFQLHRHVAAHSVIRSQHRSKAD